jgi:hypothetical protein
LSVPPVSPTMLIQDLLQFTRLDVLRISTFQDLQIIQNKLH